jgi:hypothetical protein
MHVPVPDNLANTRIAISRVSPPIKRECLRKQEKREKEREKEATNRLALCKRSRFFRVAPDTRMPVIVTISGTRSPFFFSFSIQILLRERFAERVTRITPAFGERSAL